MKKILLWLIATCCLLTAVCASAQTSQTGSDYIARRLQLPLADPPQKVPSATVSVSGNPGPATYFYWIVTNSLVGSSSPAGPFAIATSPNTLGGSNFNVVSWNTSLGAVNYDVLRTATPGPPFGACNCAVATAVTGNTVNDQSNTLNAYTVNTLDPSTLLWTLTNESSGAGLSQFTLRANGVAKFTLASNAAAGVLATPFTAPAHQFLTTLSAGGAFSSAQPASADISDGTGTGVVARQTGASLSSPSISGAVLDAAGANNSVTLLSAQPPTGTLTGNSTDQTLFTYTMPANTLAAGGCLEIVWYAQHQAGTASAAIKLFFGSELLANNGHSNNLTVVRQVAYVCNNAGVQNAQFSIAEDRENNNTVVLSVQPSTESQLTSNSVVIKGTFNVANTDQWQGKFFTVRLVQ